MTAAAGLRRSGPGSVVTSLGADGLVATIAAGAWLARAPEPIGGNPTGAGDAVAAVLALSLSGRLAEPGWPQALRHAAVACLVHAQHAVDAFHQAARPVGPAE